jgi:hypothetical protein
MKKQRILFLFASLFVASVLFVACEGPMGPAGADGTNGTNGLNGTDGTDGVDGNVVCLQCHTLANKEAKHMQYEQSVHHEGEYVSYAGGRKSCAECHSHEGYVETEFTGYDTTAADVPYPHAFACATCHDFHSTLDFENDGADYALRGNKPVKFKFDKSTHDFASSTNLCGQCHQTRTAPPSMTLDSFSITSTHWGPHHGPQANVFYGIGGFEVAGSESYPTPGTHAHAKDASCNTCHMGTYTSGKGGHTFHPNIDNCKTCHTGATSFDVKGVQTDISNLLDQIEAKLVTAGAMKDGHVVTGKYPIDVAGAYFNWALCGFEDKSFGVHNPDYVKALLTNTLEAL